MKLIETKTLGTAAASIEFTSIPQTFTDLVIHLSLRTAHSDVANDLVYRVNGDSGANRYTFRRLSVDGSAASSGSGSLDRGYFGVVDGNTATANTFGNGTLYVPNYAGATQKSFSSDSVSENNGTAAFLFIIAGLYNQTTAISSIIFYSESAANILAGSTISLYGITKGSDGIVTTS